MMDLKLGFWQVKMAEEFHELKMKCLQAPVLAFADFHKSFLLEMSVSSDGLGVVLFQKQGDGKYHSVAYASRSLQGSEEKYHSSKLEFLALKWAMVNTCNTSLSTSGPAITL